MLFRHFKITNFGAVTAIVQYRETVILLHKVIIPSESYIGPCLIYSLQQLHFQLFRLFNLYWFIIKSIAANNTAQDRQFARVFHVLLLKLKCHYKIKQRLFIHNYFRHVVNLDKVFIHHTFCHASFLARMWTVNVDWLFKIWMCR